MNKKRIFLYLVVSIELISMSFMYKSKKEKEEVILETFPSQEYLEILEEIQVQ